MPLEAGIRVVSPKLPNYLGSPMSLLQRASNLLHAADLTLRGYVELHRLNAEAFPEWRWYHMFKSSVRAEMTAVVAWRIATDPAFAERVFEASMLHIEAVDSLFPSGPALRDLMTFEAFVAVSRMQIDLANGETESDAAEVLLDAIIG
jgi:hypothetical protein